MPHYFMHISFRGQCALYHCHAQSFPYRPLFDPRGLFVLITAPTLLVPVWAVLVGGTPIAAVATAVNIVVTAVLYMLEARGMALLFMSGYGYCATHASAR
jgi:hypothetical protein